MWHQGWDDFFAQNELGKYPGEDVIRFVASKFYGAPNRSDVKLLEIGCGAGVNLWYMAREGFQVTGIDGSQIALDRAAKFLEAEGYSAGLDCGDVVRLPYADQSFDGVIDIECLSAMTAAVGTKVLAEVSRVLKPGGYFYSRTIGVGCTGEGDPVEGEPNTFTNLRSPVLRRGFGVHRFMDEAEIVPFYGQFFEVAEYESTTSSHRNRTAFRKHWQITCRKS